MSKSVIASLKPYYYYLVSEDIKKIEVRKSAPKTDDWNRETYFYMSRDEKSFAKIPKEYQDKYRKHFGKVGLKFVCERIVGNFKYLVTPKGLECACLTEQEVNDYLGVKGGYGWHITDLKIYDKPKELSEFYRECPQAYSSYEDGCCAEICVFHEEGFCKQFCLPITKAPQSWCYCEELEK